MTLPYYLSIRKGGKQARWKQLTQKLALLRPLLREKRDVRRFRGYLSREPPVHAGITLVEVFDAFSREWQASHGEIDLDRLLAVKFSTKSNPLTEAHWGQALTELARLSEERFLLKRLNEYPEDRARLLAESLQDEGEFVLFKQAYAGWDNTIEALPAGSQRALLRWYHTHVGYYALDLVEMRWPDFTVEAVRRELILQQELQQAMYNNERLSEVQVYPITNLPVSKRINASTTELTALHLRIHLLCKNAAGARNSYRSVKRNFLELCPFLEWSQQHTIYILLRNYLVKSKREGADWVIPEMLFWVQYVNRYANQLRLRSLPRQVFDNHLHLALVAGELELARRTADRLIPLMADCLQDELRICSGVYLNFFLENYEDVVNADHRSIISRRATNEADVVRFKSYRLRSNLALLLEPNTSEQRLRQTEAALRTFEKGLEQRNPPMHEDRYHQLREFLRICRVLRAHLDPHAKRPVPLARIREDLLNNPNVHAGKWLLDFCEKVATHNLSDRR